MAGFFLGAPLERYSVWLEGSFGSVAAVRAASLAQLKEVPGLSTTLAQAVFDYFQAS